LPFALDEKDPDRWQRELDDLAECVGGLLKRGRCDVEQDKVNPGDERWQRQSDGNDGAISGCRGRR
jgi:hypothetical protein